jgi:hypothetical protein
MTEFASPPGCPSGGDKGMAVQITVVYVPNASASNITNDAADGLSIAAAEEAKFKSDISHVVNLRDASSAGS